MKQKLSSTIHRLFCFFCLFGLMLFANTSLATKRAGSAAEPKQITVTGKVTDQNSISLIGVAIIVKGQTNIGTITDTEGNYKITVPSHSTLVFSYLGFQTQEKMVLEQTIINVILKSDDLNLDEVVIVGYDAVKKSDLTGSVATVNAKDLALTATANFDQALADLKHILASSRLRSGPSMARNPALLKRLGV